MRTGGRCSRRMSHTLEGAIFVIGLGPVRHSYIKLTLCGSPCTFGRSTLKDVCISFAPLLLCSGSNMGNTANKPSLWVMLQTLFSCSPVYAMFAWLLVGANFAADAESTSSCIHQSKRISARRRNITCIPYIFVWNVVSTGSSRHC